MTDPIPDAWREEVALKPCPFCGGEPVVKNRGAGGVGCHQGHHVQVYGATVAEAITAWNRRASLPTPVGALDVLRREEAAGYRAKLAELEQWTGSAFLADEKVEDEAAEKTALYGFLCGLLGYLEAAAQLCERAIAGEGESERTFAATAVNRAYQDEHATSAEARLAALERERGEMQAAIKAVLTHIEAMQANAIDYLTDRMSAEDFINVTLGALDGPRQRDVQEALLATIAKGEG